MRNYFDFRLKGAQIFPYAMAGWVVLMALAVITSLPDIIEACSGVVRQPEERLLDIGLLWDTLISMGTYLVQLIVGYGVLFFIVKATVAGLSLGEERFVPEYDFKRYAWMVVKGAFFSVITLGVYFPWFMTRMVRYFSENTSFKFNVFKFNGNGATLFGIIVLTMVLPIFLFVMFMPVIFISSAVAHSMMILWAFLFVVAMMMLSALCMALTLKWFCDFSHGSKRITSEMRVAHSTFFIVGQMLLVVITLGLYTPMYMLRIYRYFIGRMVLGDEVVEDRFGYTLNVWRDYFFVLGQGLLTVITIGIYWPWAYARITTRIFTRSYVEIVDEQKK